jgi:hypothetical protein
VLFLRYYSKFQAPFDVVGSSHNGSSISAHYFIDGQATPGVPADGTNKFLVNLRELARRARATPVAGAAQRVRLPPRAARATTAITSSPRGSCLAQHEPAVRFRPRVRQPRPEVILSELDRWYLLGVHGAAPTPRDSATVAIAAWLDGVLVADFGRTCGLRDVDTLTIDRFGLSFHIGRAAARRARLRAAARRRQRTSARPINTEVRARLEILIWEAGSSALEVPELGRVDLGLAERTFEALIGQPAHGPCAVACSRRAASR